MNNTVSIYDKDDQLVTEVIAKESNPNGRPLKFTENELIKRIDEFFKDCETRERKPTFGRLAVFLDTDRKTILNYSKTEKFFPIIKSVRQRIGAEMEEILVEPTNRNSTGAIFYLKNNLEYVDKIETITKDGDLDKKQEMLNQFSNDVNKLDSISRNLNGRFFIQNE